jgi:hypothetical protein
MVMSSVSHAASLIQRVDASTLLSNDSSTLSLNSSITLDSAPNITQTNSFYADELVLNDVYPGIMVTEVTPRSPAVCACDQS